jgi:hypothetical protein
VRQSRSLLYPLALALAASCGKATQPTQRGVNLFNTYNLVSIDGSAPPSGFGSSLTLRSDSTFTYTERNGSTVTFVTNGRFTQLFQTTMAGLSDALATVRLTVSQSSGGPAAGPCATQCDATLLQTGLFLQPASAPPGTVTGEGW